MKTEMALYGDSFPKVATCRIGRRVSREIQDGINAYPRRILGGKSDQDA